MYPGRAGPTLCGRDAKGAVMLECPRCGYGNAPDADFCANPDCHAFLGFDSRRPTSTGGPPSSPRPAEPPIPQPGPPPGPHGRPFPPPIPPATAVHPMGGGPMGPQGQRRGVRLKLEPAELTVEPGSVATAGVTVRNAGTRVEGISLSLTGPAAAFGTIQPPSMAVFPDAEQQAVVRFMPARG